MYLDLEGKTLAELRQEAKKLGIKRVSGIKKDELVKNIKIAIHEINVSEAAEKAQAQEKTPETPVPEAYLRSWRTDMVFYVPRISSRETMIFTYPSHR